MRARGRRPLAGGRADEWPTSPAFLIAGLLAHHHHARRRRPFSEQGHTHIAGRIGRFFVSHRSARAFVQIAGSGVQSAPIEVFAPMVWEPKLRNRSLDPAAVEP
jgi:hypothetical protein